MRRDSSRHPDGVWCSDDERIKEYAEAYLNGGYGSTEAVAFVRSIVESETEPYPPSEVFATG